MSSEQQQTNAEVVQRHIEDVWHEGNLDALNELFTSDHTVVGIPNARESVDSEEHRGFVAAMREAFPDLHYEYDADEIVADETGAAVSWTATGTHEGELMGIEPTGNEMSVRGVMIAYVEDDKIERLDVVWDEFGMFQQLEVDPAQLAQ